MRDGDRDRPQLSPAAPIGWQFVQNPTQTTSLTTHQQILKAYMQPPPASLRRCCTTSKPDAGAPPLTFTRTAVLLVKTAASATSASASTFGWFCVFFIEQDVVDLYSLIISPGGNQADKELSSRQ